MMMLLFRVPKIKKFEDGFTGAVTRLTSEKATILYSFWSHYARWLISSQNYQSIFRSADASS
jgi:hypothetical protein